MDSSDSEGNKHSINTQRICGPTIEIWFNQLLVHLKTSRLVCVGLGNRVFCHFLIFYTFTQKKSTFLVDGGRPLSLCRDMLTKKSSFFTPSSNMQFGLLGF